MKTHTHTKFNDYSIIYIAEIHKDTGEKSDEEEEAEKPVEIEQPAVDENGRILFRKRASTKRDLKSIIDEEVKNAKEPAKKKKKKVQQKVSLLSFEDDDDQ